MGVHEEHSAKQPSWQEQKRARREYVTNFFIDTPTKDGDVLRVAYITQGVSEMKEGKSRLHYGGHSHGKRNVTGITIQEVVPTFIEAGQVEVGGITIVSRSRAIG